MLVDFFMKRLTKSDDVIMASKFRLAKYLLLSPWSWLWRLTKVFWRDSG